ncbi:MAG: helix-turn-helix transcriptional regulator [Clostridiales bacterium]|nr:helix-turn-helix transcriptional regulator [Clostridiales bacterium]
MDQERIGSFIAECRRNKKLTQLQLAEKLGITDKAVSKWETGKGLPDASIMIDLCDELDISVNELLSGEKLTQDNYQEKANENIVSMVKVADKNRKSKNKIILIFLILILLFLTCKVLFGVYQNIETNVDYDERIMKCEIIDDTIIYEINGLSVVSADYEQINTETETLIFFTNKILLQNKIRSHWESWDSFAQLSNGEDVKFKARFTIDIKDILDCKEKIKVYYTDVSLNKIKKLNQDELQEILQKSKLLVEQ